MTSYDQWLLMENGQKTVSDLFESRRIFNIPNYQRAYSWERKQLQDFMDDLDNQMLGKDYFLGTILLQIGENDGLFKIVDIVDGQQRITTLTIFIKILLDKLDSFEDDVSILRETYIKYRESYKLRVLDYDQDFFEKFILEDGDNGTVSITTPSQRRLLDAKLFFDKQLKNRSEEELRELQIKIENAKVLTYSVANNAEATLIFETTNDRGKPLTNLEKIKSFLMYKIYVASSEPEKYLKSIQQRFGDIYRDYEDILVHLTINDDFILRNHYLAFESKSKLKQTNDDSNHIELVRAKINALTGNPERFPVATTFIDEYSRGLRETCALIKKLSRMIRGDLLNIFHLTRTANFYPLLIACLKYESGSNTDIWRVIKLLEIISFRVYGVRKRRAKNTTIRYRLLMLAQNFNGDFQALIENLKDLIGEYCSDYEFGLRLSSPDFYEDISSNDACYLLWHYENHVRQNNFLEEKLSFTPRKWSIEHISPQNPRHSFYPTQDINVHSIGNLTLDVPWENSAKSNMPFDRKYQSFYNNTPDRIKRSKDRRHGGFGSWDGI
jgi:Protein of unknown function DUF262/Protein of unknown function (DUF1524)